MKSLILTFATKAEFLATYLGNFEDGGLFVETESPFVLAENLSLQIFVPEVLEGVKLSATVQWIRPKPKWRSALKSGIGVSFFNAENDKVDFLLAHCNDLIETARKTDKRVLVDMKVEVISYGRKIPCRTKDISRSGVSILTNDEFTQGEFIEFDLFVSEESAPERFRGQVMWCRNKDGVNGVGVKFDFQTPFRQKRVQYLVNTIIQRSVHPSGSLYSYPIKSSLV